MTLEILSFDNDQATVEFHPKLFDIFASINILCLSAFRKHVVESVLWGPHIDETSVSVTAELISEIRDQMTRGDRDVIILSLPDTGWKSCHQIISLATIGGVISETDFTMTFGFARIEALGLLDEMHLCLHKFGCMRRTDQFRRRVEQTKVVVPKILDDPIEQ